MYIGDFRHSPVNKETSQPPPRELTSHSSTCLLARLHFSFFHYSSIHPPSRSQSDALKPQLTSRGNSRRIGPKLSLLSAATWLLYLIQWSRLLSQRRHLRSCFGKMLCASWKPPTTRCFFRPMCAIWSARETSIRSKLASGNAYSQKEVTPRASTDMKQCSSWCPCSRLHWWVDRRLSSYAYPSVFGYDGVCCIPRFDDKTPPKRASEGFDGYGREVPNYFQRL